MEPPEPVPSKRFTLRTIATFLLGPGALLPMGFIVAVLMGFVIYTPPEVTGKLEHLLFFQGSTDMGGGCLFAGTMALYVYFGFTAALYLTLRLSEEPPASTFGLDLRRALWFLKFHIAAFLIGGLGNIGYDSRVISNDFRNMFLFVCALYAGGVLLIVLLHRAMKSIIFRLLLAPTLIVLWMIVGADGNTSRAGQLVQSGQNPQPIVRGVRHGIMLAWHRGCDAVLGNVDEATDAYYAVATTYLSNLVLLGLVLFGLHALDMFLARKGVVSQKQFWGLLGLLTLSVFLITGTVHYFRFDKERQVIMPILAEVSANLTPADVEAMQADPAMRIREKELLKSKLLSPSVVDRISRILRPEYFTNQVAVVILVPLPENFFLFLLRIFFKFSKLN